MSAPPVRNSPDEGCIAAGEVAGKPATELDVTGKPHTGCHADRPSPASSKSQDINHG